jgi:hypothetical protein
MGIDYEDVRNQVGSRGCQRAGLGGLCLSFFRLLGQTYLFGSVFRALPFTLCNRVMGDACNPGKLFSTFRRFLRKVVSEVGTSTLSFLNPSQAAVAEAKRGKASREYAGEVEKMKAEAQEKKKEGGEERWKGCWERKAQKG